MDDWDSGETSRNVARVLFGRFARADRSEHICSVRNVSIDGAEFMSTALPAYGEALVAHLEHFGRIDSRAGSATGNGFMVQWDIHPDDRVPFLSKLTWLDDYYSGRNAESRQHNRRQLDNARSVVTLLDGRRFPCEIRDISMSGAGVTINRVPDVGAKLYLGKVLCEVMRHSDDGLGVRFLTASSDLMSDLLSEEAF